MNWGKAIQLIESGEARLVATTTVLLEHDGALWMSFDGIEWEKLDSRMARRLMVK